MEHALGEGSYYVIMCARRIWREVQRDECNFVRSKNLLCVLRGRCSRRCLENSDVSQFRGKHSEINQASSFDEQLQTFKLSYRIYFFTDLWIYSFPRFTQHGIHNHMTSFKIKVMALPVPMWQDATLDSRKKRGQPRSLPSR